MNIQAIRTTLTSKVKQASIVAAAWAGEHPKTVTAATIAVSVLCNRNNVKRTTAYAVMPKRAFIKDIVGHAGLAKSVYELCQLIDCEFKAERAREEAIAAAQKTAE